MNPHEFGEIAKDGDSVPSIRKCMRVEGKTLSFRNVQRVDADIILSLRTDAEKSRYLSATSTDLAAQLAWLDGYASATNPIGTVRPCDARGNSFC